VVTVCLGTDTLLEPEGEGDVWKAVLADAATLAGALAATVAAAVAEASVSLTLRQIPLLTRLGY
jgi:hypothetical protein